MHIGSRTSLLSWSLPLASLAFCFALLPSAQGQDLLTLLNGEEATGEVEAIFRDGIIAGEGLPAGLTLESLIELEREGETQARAFRGVEVLLAAQGGILGAESATLSEDMCMLSGTVAGEIKVKIERLRSLLLTAGPPAEVFLQAQETPLRLSDIVFLNSEDGPRALEALVESIHADTITINWEGEVRDVSRERIYGIVFAERQPDRSNARCRVRFRNGDELAGAILELRDEQLTLQTPFSPGLELPFDEVAGIEISSTRHVYLSDLDPIDVEESTLLSLPAPWQRNLSVGGRPLRLGDRQYKRGLGVHAESRLTFTVQQQFDTLYAVVGIDAETEGHGDCEVVVYADDVELFRERVRGGEQPVAIRLDLGDTRRITLAVEAGEGYELADHVSWCDARLLNLNDD